MFVRSTLVILFTVCVIIQSCQNVNETECDDVVNLEQNQAKIGLSQQNEYAQVVRENFILINNREDIVSADLTEGSGSLLQPLEGSGTDIKIQSTPDISKCIESGYDTVCSKNGKCIDNKCVCDIIPIEVDNTTTMYRFSGNYCEECPYCRGNRCHRFLSCSECNLLHKKSNCDQYCQFQYTVVNKVIHNIDNDEKICDIENADGCFIKFKYYYNAENVVRVEYEKEIFCFNGLKFVIFTFWGVVVYIFALALLVPRLCFLSRRPKINKSTTSLSRGHDILRLDFFRRIDS